LQSKIYTHNLKDSGKLIFVFLDDDDDDDDDDIDVF
jgi:hypothetical protein